MLVIFLVACGLALAQGIVCPPDYCQRASCPDLSACKGTVKPNAGFCGCCGLCVELLGENERCSFVYLMGVPSGQQCGAGLHCNPTTGTCVKTFHKRQAVGACTLRQNQLNQGASHGLPILGAQKLRCNVDGSYNPVQCMGSVCYCVDKDGIEITGYKTNIGATDYATKNCQCARDKATFLKTGMVGQTFNCEANGNYQQYQCRGSVCFCVDDNGKKLGTQAVSIGLLSTLRCSP